VMKGTAMANGGTRYGGEDQPKSWWVISGWVSGFAWPGRSRWA
jgi:hypothetical protein